MDVVVNTASYEMKEKQRQGTERKRERESVKTERSGSFTDRLPER